VIVDDAVQTGLTTMAGVGFLQRRGASKVVVAVPCGVSSALRRIEAMGAEVVCPVEVEHASEIAEHFEHLPEITAEEVKVLLARGGPSRPQGMEQAAPAERSIRLVDELAVAHRALLHLPQGLGPAPGVVLVGAGAEPGHAAGAAWALRLAEAGLASVRLEGGGGAALGTVLREAVTVLSARPEVDPFRLGLVAAGHAAPAGLTLLDEDRRIRAAVFVGLEDERALCLQGESLEPGGADAAARWLADHLQPTESA
jgi:hypothetical protein